MEINYKCRFCNDVVKLPNTENLFIKAIYKNVAKNRELCSKCVILEQRAHKKREHYALSYA